MSDLPARNKELDRIAMNASRESLPWYAPFVGNPQLMQADKSGYNTNALAKLQQMRLADAIKRANLMRGQMSPAEQFGQKTSGELAGVPELQ
jgi:hypothetical protein